MLKSYPILFKLWYFIYRRNRGVKINYFSPNTSFLLDGYPRSGNTFFAGLCKSIFGGESFISHFHSIAPIKIAFTKNIPVFILIRKPEQAISSYYLKTFSLEKSHLPKQTDMTLLEKLTKNYVDFYSYVYRHRDKIELIAFEDHISNPSKIIDIINQTVFQEKFVVDNKKIENYKMEYKGATDTLGSSRPNQVKEDLKSEINNSLITVKQFNLSSELYNLLANRNE